MTAYKESAPKLGGATRKATSIVADRADINPLLGAAFWYAEAGFSVLPCRETGPQAKAPYVQNGFRAASSDPVQITDWWQRWPGALIGLAVPKQCFVLDFDSLPVSDLEAKLKNVLPKKTMAKTGRDSVPGAGVHLWFTRPVADGVALPTSQSGLKVGGVSMVGVDVRLGGRGYVVAPPSHHPVTGRKYEWLAWAWPPPPPPADLTEALKPVKPVKYSRQCPAWSGKQPSFAGLISRMATAQPGERNQILFWSFCKAIEEQADQQALEALADAASATGLTEGEILACLRSARRTVRGGRSGK